MAKRCTKCLGYGELYKMGSAYSLTDTGGYLATCPKCEGDGLDVSLADEIEKTKARLAAMDAEDNAPAGYRRKRGRPKTRS